jgi:3alpha(or 20beta)-hydroxysteroid dehydrogenase
MRRPLDRLAVVIGATGDIGKACVTKLQADGWQLVLVGRNRDRLERMRNTGSRPPWEVYSADMLHRDEYVDVLHAIRSKHPIVHGLVNAAGIHGANWHELNAGRWDHTMAVNLMGPMIAIHELEHALAAAGAASVVNVSSLAAREGYGKPDYAASKAGLEALTRSLAVVLGPRGIRVNCVAPGPVTGRMTGTWSGKRKEATEKRMPLGRFVTSVEVAEAIGFLLSEAGSGVTGTALAIDGGLGCRFGP